MIRSLFTGVTGLKQHQTKMDVLSNNIANVNTTAFKRGRVMFQDLFSETLRHGQQAFGDYGGLNPMQVGLGVSKAAIDTLMDQGAIEGTGKQTDIAIEGAGFFSVRGYDGNLYYTRDGNLNINPNYDMVMTNTGFKMQGWLATQNPKTGNLEMKETGVVPYDINITKYLKKHAHQTNAITYSCNLDSASNERDIEFGLDTLTFKNSQGEFENLTFKFKKLDANNWIWSAVDDTEGNVATGTIKTDDDGKVLESTVEPAGPTSSVAQPYFTYDPDGDPRPATATMPINAISNTGDGISSGVTASGTEVENETVQIIFDGGDPTRATSYRVVGSERGFIGAGTLGGEQARVQGAPVGFGTHWTPAAGATFDIADNQFNPARVATVTFDAGITYSNSEIVDTINTAMKNNGVRATAYYDAITQQFQIVSNDIGSNRELEILNETGDFADLNLPTGVFTGTGGSRPEVFSDTATAQTYSMEWDPENDRWDPASDVSLTITDRDGRTALINFSDIVAGNNQIYTRGAILAEINSRLAQENVAATASFADTDNNGSPDQLIIIGNSSGSGERVIISGTGYEQLGLAAGDYAGTAAVSEFNYGGLEFSLTEGNNPWLPNESMSFTTTAEKGTSDSVNIMVPQPSADMLEFSATVNGETFKINGAVSEGARHATNIIIYDSLGGKHGLVTSWEHTNKETMEWSYKVSYSDDDVEIVNWLKDPANNVTDPEDPTKEDLERANDALITNREGKMYFFENGKIDLGRSYVPTLSMTPKGSNPLSINLTTELITQFDSDFSTKAEYQDGYEMGLLEQIYFEEDGIIRGVFSNGQKQPIGQVALTTFNNPAGLEKNGKNLYSYAPNSGQPVVGKAGMMDRGVIVAASLEMSNVDISEEFTNMIITQRAFQANSRVITTSDEMLQEVVNLKR